MKEFGKKYPLVFGILGFAVVYVLFKLINVEGYLLSGLERCGISALLILVLWPALGNEWIKFPGGGWKSSFKLYKVPLIVLGVLGAIVVIGNLVVAGLVKLDPDGELARSLAEKGMGKLNPNLISDFFTIAFFMLSVGIFEELTFRRTLFYTGLLQFPKMKNRAIWMAIISSFMFGFVHVMASLSTDWLAIITAILKVLCTGITGFIMCAAVIDGQNIWPVAVIHMISDFVLALPKIFSLESTIKSVTETEYVVTSTSATPIAAALLPNIILTLISIPALINSVKILKKYDEEHN